MTTIRTHCALRLGDNLCHLHFLRGMAKKYPDVHFVHSAHLCYLQQMIDVVADLPNVQLRDIEHADKEYSIDAWKNAGGFWEKHPLKNDFANFSLVWFDELARRMSLESPFERPDGLLFDYPALYRDNLPDHLRKPIDWLVVNSPPMSGQWRGYDQPAFNTLIQSLAQRGIVVTTHPTGLPIPCTHQVMGFSVTNIGQLSQCAKNILMVSTGPSWPTFNVWNHSIEQFRLVLIDHENLAGLARDNGMYDQCSSIASATRVLKVRGLL